MLFDLDKTSNLQVDVASSRGLGHPAVSATLLTIAHAPKSNTLRKLFTTTWTTTALRQIRNCDVNWTQHVSGAGPYVQTYVRQDIRLHLDDGLITHQMTQKIDLKVRYILT